MELFFSNDFSKFLGLSMLFTQPANVMISSLSFEQPELVENGMAALKQI